VSRELGKQGYVYVEREDAFLNTPKRGMTMEFVCMRAGEEAADLAKILP
jgi:hypothetical protein